MTKNYSLRTLVKARRGISGADRNEINQYTRRDLSAMLQRDFKSEQTYWETLTEAVQVLYYHSDQIVRHEAAFVLAGIPYKNDLEKSVTVRDLRIAMRTDPSIVVQHETAEALGDIY